MRIVILYNEASRDAAVDDRDVLVQAAAVAESLERLGHEPIRLGCTLDLESLRSQLVGLQPDLVFNLVESLAGTDRLLALPALLLDALQIPYTGSASSALLGTTNKLAAKQRLLAAGLPTPAWYAPGPPDGVRGDAVSLLAAGERVILKAVWEHASFALEADAVHAIASPAELDQLLRHREETTRRPWFAEQFIDGREFNLSLLQVEEPDAAGGSKGRAAVWQVLPPAEIDFVSFAPGEPRIVGYRAKWAENSFEYRYTPRKFTFEPTEAALLESLRGWAERSAALFEVTGYARVDFRVDASGRPWILELNANPCLSPDAGFAAALAQAGISYDQAIHDIVTAALRRETAHGARTSSESDRS